MTNGMVLLNLLELVNFKTLCFIPRVFPGHEASSPPQIHICGRILPRVLGAVRGVTRRGASPRHRGAGAHQTV